MTQSAFKVIVIGGGPVGLTTAHSLEKAGINFVLLEQRKEVVIDAGSNLVLSPVGLKALTELGLGPQIDAISTPLSRIERMDHQGANMGSMIWFERMKELTGVAPRVISRHLLTKVLYDELTPESQKSIFGNQKLADITATEQGVQVTCTDGSSYDGSMVIGADGAHSLVRRKMNDLAKAAGSTNVNPESSFPATYRCMWVRFPLRPEFKPGMTCETHGKNASTQFFVGHDSGVMGVYEPLEAPTHERLRFTEADKEAFVARWSHLPLIPGSAVTFGEAYKTKQESGLVSLEEGVAQHWSYDSRIVLVGDAAHKFTPSTGAGCNNGIVDVAALINRLNVAIGADRVGVDRQRIQAAFEDYQDFRFASVQKACQGSGQATASSVWQTGIHKFMDRHVISKHMVQRILSTTFAKEFSTGPLFDFTAPKATAVC